jgi:hypothetical protein
MQPHGGALRFTPRSCDFDWRQLHGTDLDEVVRCSDVAAVEALLPMLQQGRLDREAGACVRNCTQLVSEWTPLGCHPRPRPLDGSPLGTRRARMPACTRLVQAQACQLAVEYLSHLKAAHLRLVASHQHAVGRAGRWAACLPCLSDEGGTKHWAARLAARQGQSRPGRGHRPHASRSTGHGAARAHGPAAARAACSWKEAARAYIAAVHEAQQQQAQLSQQGGRARRCLAQSCACTGRAHPRLCAGGLLPRAARGPTSSTPERWRWA